MSQEIEIKFQEKFYLFTGIFFKSSVTKVRCPFCGQHVPVLEVNEKSCTITESGANIIDPKIRKEIIRIVTLQKQQSWIQSIQNNGSCELCPRKLKPWLYS